MTMGGLTIYACVHLCTHTFNHKPQTVSVVMLCTMCCLRLNSSYRAKGNPVPIPEPGCVTASLRALACERSSG